ncbi:MAG: phage major capsid protein [bacterium]|nr:phage major capsid protein [bacterium]
MQAATRGDGRSSIPGQATHSAAQRSVDGHTIPQLLTMYIPTGTGGAHVPVMTQEAGKFYILGLETIFTEKLPTLGTTGDIVLADFTQYTIGMRREIELARSEHIKFDSDETAYRCLVRADGQGSWDAAITPKNGDSLSWCVSLATRS